MTDPYDVEIEKQLVDEANAVCDECAHPVRLHNAKYGCQYERGDSWVTGSHPEAHTILMAMGPCGCKAKCLWLEQWIRRFLNWIFGGCYCEQPEPVEIAEEAGMCNRCKRRLW